MTSSKKLRIICYDISDNRIRRRVARVLEEEATRVQFSVFEARLNATATKRLLSRVSSQLEANDSIRIYTIGKTGERYCTVQGDGIPVDKNVSHWLF